MVFSPGPEIARLEVKPRRPLFNSVKLRLNIAEAQCQPDTVSCASSSPQTEWSKFSGKVIVYMEDLDIFFCLREVCGRFTSGDLIGTVL